ncbi:hypothetical protein [Delftia acidovorans]|uniref:hypothetical protein n=1 Tax=Delftia acidovorans TaxID=80866 RepID=UPI000BD1806C|nr:hypothetical protein [Delftia acidovorans]SOE35859.1 hypothetical protein SAMN05216519_1852 [Delftia acidovorans]
MEEKMHWLPTSIGMAVLVCIFGGISLGIYPGWSVIGDFLTANIKINLNLNLDQNAPAWMQGIGSLVGIGIAIYVPFKIEANKESLKRLEKRREAILFWNNYIKQIRRNSLAVDECEKLLASSISVVRDSNGRSSKNFELDRLRKNICETMSKVAGVSLDVCNFASALDDDLPILMLRQKRLSEEFCDAVNSISNDLFEDHGTEERFELDVSLIKIRSISRRIMDISMRSID